MPGTPTPILDLIVPTVGGDNNTWGTELNTDLGIIDNLGAATIINVNSAYVAVPNVFPETVYRVATGGSPLTFTLPTPASVTGKIFTIKKVDGGSGYVNVVGPIDGQSSYFVINQFAVVRLISNGGSFDVIGVY
jgi:hypothetical protein